MKTTIELLLIFTFRIFCSVTGSFSEWSKVLMHRSKEIAAGINASKNYSCKSATLKSRLEVLHL